MCFCHDSPATIARNQLSVDTKKPALGRFFKRIRQPLAELLENQGCVGAAKAEAV